MLIVKHLDFGDFKAVRAYRLQVKERLYKFNYVRLSSSNTRFVNDLMSLKEILAQMDKQERVEKLEETFQNVTQDYRRILGMI